MYRQHQDISAGTPQQYQFQSNASPYGYSAFPGNMGSVLGAPLQSSPQHLSPQTVMTRKSTDGRHGSTESGTAMRAASRSLSPRLNDATPTRSLPFTPTDRSLPSKDVSPETITDAYIAFILYCNPNFSLDVDTTTLRTTFQTPPKSDNKDFEIYPLFELIQRFESKEIKTWSQLALELGVEAPDVSKGQSVQKVQQYTVRLKRWMRAMHVDAFFDYLLDKDHAYFTEIPHPNDPHPPGGRDGVIAEEDLAIRALDPSFRPKRGRRRNSDAEQDTEYDATTSTRRTRQTDETMQTFSHSSPGMVMMPFSARPDNLNDPWAVASAVTPQTFAPWSAKRGGPQSSLSSAGPSQLRWQVHEEPQNPLAPHPMTAHPSSVVDNLDSAFDAEPKSAINPSARKRRRHGPAVSSAWPSSSGAGAKPRGRPPASRNTQDGPFNTFPADPANEKSTNQSFSAPIARMESLAPGEEPILVDFPVPPARSNDSLIKPGRLSLQVPPHTGGPVRLATPPRLLVNGETDEKMIADSHGLRSISTQPGAQQPNTQFRRLANLQTIDREIPGFAFEALKRVVTSDLLRAELAGRPQRLNGEEAKRLAQAILERFNIPKEDTDSSRDDIARLTAASWLGVGDQLNVPLGPAIGQNKRIAVTRFSIDNEGYEEIISAYDDKPGQIREVFDLSWTVTMGGCNGSFELKGLSLVESGSKETDIHDQILDAWYETAQRVGVGEDDLGRLRQTISQDNNASIPGDENIDWKARCQALEFGYKMAKGEFERFRRRAVDKVLDALV